MRNGGPMIFPGGVYELQELVEELRAELVPVSAFVQKPTVHVGPAPYRAFTIDEDALADARKSMKRVHELMTQIREVLR
jgi:alpha-glucosidase (family GH31 glycosyl hydrolase)